MRIEVGKRYLAHHTSVFFKNDYWVFLMVHKRTQNKKNIYLGVKIGAHIVSGEDAQAWWFDEDGKSLESPNLDGQHVVFSLSRSTKA